MTVWPRRRSSQSDRAEEWRDRRVGREEGVGEEREERRGGVVGGEVVELLGVAGPQLLHVLPLPAVGRPPAAAPRTPSASHAVPAHPRRKRR